MMKKRNIAVAMAAVTVASTVAPAFAAGKETPAPIDGGKFVVSNEKVQELVKKVGKLLKEKYVDSEYKGENVYSIKVSYKVAGQEKLEVEEINEVIELEDIISNENYSDILVTITDNGHVKKEDGNHRKAIETYDDEALIILSERLQGKNGILSVERDKKNTVTAEVGFALESTIFNKASVKFKIQNKDEKIKTDEIEVNLNEEIETLNNFIETLNKTVEDNLKTLNNPIINGDGFTGLDSNGIYDALLNLKLSTEINFVESLIADKEITTTQKQLINELVNEEFRSDVEKAFEYATELKDIMTTKDSVNFTNNDEIETLVKNLKIKLINIQERIKGKDETLRYITSMYGLKNIKGFVKEEEKEILGTEYNVVFGDVEEETVEAETLFDGTKLTDQGKELIDILNNGLKIDDKVFDVKPEGEYKITGNKKDGFELVMDFIGTENPNKKAKTNALETIRFQVKVASEDRKELENIKDMFTVKNGQVAGYPIDSIIGARRTETAVKISKENFEPSKKDGNVVLVGANAVVDGLAAGPLAKKLDAPVLLTNADSLDAKVEEEISRLLVDDTRVADLKTQTVYIVGGEAVVSENVVEQLENLGIKVERLAGDRRDTTALAVAEKMDDLGAKFEKAFVVGANGEADAMSIAAHAAKIEAPIIVNGLDGTLSKEAKKLIKDKQIDIIGGETVVSKELAEELKDIDKDKKVVRVEGSNREETNANVIKKYYSSVEHVYIAKDGKVEGNDKLVDALAISPVAAKDGVVVLATNDLTKEQKEALDSKASKAKRVTQVGGGVSETVVTKVAKLLGLVK